jgi:hypothetical protein
MKNWKQWGQRCLKYIPIIFLIGVLFTDFSFAENKFATAWNGLMKEYRVIVSGIAGVGLLTSFLVFIIHMMQLASVSNSNPNARGRVIKNIFISGITTALLGATTLIFTVLYKTVFE